MSTPVMKPAQASLELRALTSALDAWRRACYARHVGHPGGSLAFIQQCKEHLVLCVEMREYFRNGVTISQESACAEVEQLIGSISSK